MLARARFSAVLILLCLAVTGPARGAPPAPPKIKIKIIKDHPNPSLNHYRSPL